MSVDRRLLGALCFSASGLVSLVGYEWYTDKAVIPVVGDVPTYGFGSTTRPDGRPVRMGDRIAPPAALELAARDVSKFEGALKRCVTVPLKQNEYDAYVLLSYNIGSNAFCNSTLVKKLNAADYYGACKEILRWDKFQGKPLPGLTTRRQKESVLCLS